MVKNLVLKNKTSKIPDDFKKTVSNLHPLMEIGPFLTIHLPEEKDLHKKRYLLQQKIGEGSFGSVWTARDRVSDLIVAVKFLNDKLNKKQILINEIKKDYLKVQHLHHPNIIPLNALEYDSSPFIGYFLVMEYFEGIDLRKWAENFRIVNNHISLSDIKNILYSIAGALDYAHAENIIHRDIKPENILLSNDMKKVKLLDFGLAQKIIVKSQEKLQEVSQISGTLLYMSPEQWKGKYQTQSSDLYSFAVLIYELLSGTMPFYNEDIFKLKSSVLNDTVPDIQGLNLPVMNVIRKALSKRKEERYDSCLKFVSELITASKKEKSSNLIKKSIKKDDSDLQIEVDDSKDITNNDKPENIDIKEINNEKIIRLDENTVIELVFVEGGEFYMGSSADNCNDNEKPIHKVKVDSFWIAKYVLTQGQWYKIMKTKPWLGFANDTDLHPVCLVSWNGYHSFLKKLNILLCKLQCDKGFFRFPTEAEWEYAAKGGLKAVHNNYTKYSGSNKIDEVGWYKKNTYESINFPHIVGKKKPNQLGIYDMSGNVWEWCADVYDKNFYRSFNENDLTVNPVNEYFSKGIFNINNFKKSKRVSRGGSWHCSANDCRVTYRNFDSAYSRFTDVGCRIVYTSEFDKDVKQ